jgi:phage shock protein A
MTEHEEHADRLEQQVDDMQERNDRLEEEIEETRNEWEARKDDPAVPGAAGDPQRAEGDPPP